MTTPSMDEMRAEYDAWRKRWNEKWPTREPRPTDAFQAAWTLATAAERERAAKDAQRRRDELISALAQIYGLIKDGRDDDAMDACRAFAETFTQEIASEDAAIRAEDKHE